MCPFCTEKIKLSYSESHDVDAESNQRRSTLCVSSEPNENHKSTLSMVFSTPEARRELEAEMYAHRHAAGDLEDISTLDRRARAVSQGSRRSVHMNRVGIGLRGAATSNRIPQNRVISDDDETEQSLRRPQSLSYLQARASSGSRGQRDSSVASSGSQAEWVALHDMLVSSRHDSIGISASDLLRLEESMLSQAMQQSLLASGVAEDMDRSCVFTDARSTPAEEIQQHTEIRLSDLSLISDNDLDEEALLELALALSLQNDESTAM